MRSSVVGCAHLLDDPDGVARQITDDDVDLCEGHPELRHDLSLDRKPFVPAERMNFYGTFS